MEDLPRELGRQPPHHRGPAQSVLERARISFVATLAGQELRRCSTLPQTLILCLR